MNKKLIIIIIPNINFIELDATFKHLETLTSTKESHTAEVNLNISISINDFKIGPTCYYKNNYNSNRTNSTFSQSN